jgi:hypothetical protein
VLPVDELENEQLRPRVFEQVQNLPDDGIFIFGSDGWRAFYRLAQISQDFLLLLL